MEIMYRYPDSSMDRSSRSESRYLHSETTTDRTEDDIGRFCHDCAQGSCPPARRQASGRLPENYRSTDAGISTFTSVISPLSELTPVYSSTNGCVQFRMRRKNKTVTLQWEPFSGSLIQSGIAYLSVMQSICNLPPYPIVIPIYIMYKGVLRGTFFQVDPYANSGQLRFYLNSDGTTTDTNVGDAISIPGGAVSWIVD